MQGSQVQSPIQEDPTCRGASKRVHHEPRACALSLRFSAGDARAATGRWRRPGQQPPSPGIERDTSGNAREPTIVSIKCK